MPTFFFPLTVLTQVFEDETALSEALNFEEISRFDTNDERRTLAVRANSEEIVKRADALGINARIAPPDCSIREILLQIEPPRNAKYWREAVELKFHYLQWQQAEGYSQAFVPALGIGIVSKDEAEFEAKIEKEIRAALTRTGATKSLEKLRRLERVQEIKIEKTELAVELKTPTQRAIDAEKDEDEKSVLEQTATKLNDAKLNPAYENEKSVGLLAETLKAKQRYSVLLVGASGAGKTAVLHELVRRREKFGFKDVPFWSSSGARLVAGQTGFGMWQERCQKLIVETKKQNAILHLGNLVELLEVGKSTSNAQGIASFFRPKITRGEIQIVVECTPEQLAVVEKRDANLLAAFQQIRVEEPDRKIGLKILQQIADENGAAKINADALKTLDAVHRRYATYSAFPGRPVRFLRNLLENKKSGESPATSADVFRAFSEETGLPLFLLSDEEKLNLGDAEKWFDERVLGQNEAVKLIVNLIATVKAKLTKPRKPIASLLFIGATGVGKTELTKALAEFFFSDRERLVRFDMSEFSTAFAVQRLIGGTGEAEGQLTAKMREQPFSVVLFDEFEKAHPQFFDLLLQVLGEGRLTDASGRVADFTNSIIVMTSNLGAETFGRGKSGFVSNAKEKQAAALHFNSAVREFLRPEIFNRIDRIVPFAPLGEETALKITAFEIEKLRQREGLRFRSIRLEIEPEVLRFLAHKGYEVRYGARPLRRAIERELAAPLAAKLNDCAVDDKLNISVVVQNDALKISVETDVSQKKRQTVGYLLANLANRAAVLRRKSQKLAASQHITELEDERFQVYKIKERKQRGRRWVSPEDLAKIDRLPYLQIYLQSVKDFLSDTARIEDRISLDIYGKAGVADKEFADELAINELRLQKSLLDLLRLKTEKPHEVSMTIHSENAAALFRLVRCYLQRAEETGADAAEIYVLTTEAQPNESPLERTLYGRTVWSVSVADAAKFFGSVRKEIVCVQIKFAGDMVFGRFAPESGVHYFIYNGQTDRVAVGTGDFSIKKTQPSERFAARGSLDDSFLKRRIYNADKDIINDTTLGKEFVFDGRSIVNATAMAIEENLQQTANNLIE